MKHLHSSSDQHTGRQKGLFAETEKHSSFISEGENGEMIKLGIWLYLPDRSDAVRSSLFFLIRLLSKHYLTWWTQSENCRGFPSAVLLAQALHVFTFLEKEKGFDEHWIILVYFGMLTVAGRNKCMQHIPKVNRCLWKASVKFSEELKDSSLIFLLMCM